MKKCVYGQMRIEKRTEKSANRQVRLCVTHQLFWIVKKQNLKEMINSIKEKLLNEDLIGIIPIESKRLKVQLDDFSLAPNIGAYLIMLSICLLPASFLMGLFSFLLLDLGFGIYFVIFVCVLILVGLMYLADKIYVNYIKKYPNSALVLTKSNLYYFLIKNDKVEKYNRFDVDTNSLGKFFYGEMNLKSGKIGKRFMIKKNGAILASGKLKIKNNRFQSEVFSNDELFPIEELREIYVS